MGVAAGAASSGANPGLRQLLAKKQELRKLLDEMGG
jgi:hypothetical protein